MTIFQVCVLKEMEGHLFQRYVVFILENVMKNVIRVFSVVLLVMVGTVFAVGPAGLIVTLLSNKGVTGAFANPEVWLWIILAYYFIATFISIDKIIGRIYPIFGICLIIMAIGVIFGIFTNPVTRFLRFGAILPICIRQASQSGALCLSQ